MKIQIANDQALKFEEQVSENEFLIDLIFNIQEREGYTTFTFEDLEEDEQEIIYAIADDCNEHLF